MQAPSTHIADGPAQLERELRPSRKLTSTPLLFYAFTITGLSRPYNFYYGTSVREEASGEDSQAVGCCVLDVVGELITWQ